ncbi:uncharacterized protein DS421_20g695410 [Arachis hypogaea]|nr:uncharacterized protein DS421_20g695410 [Arachis hypogaea]
MFEANVASNAAHQRSITLVVNVQLSEFDISIVQYPEFEEVLNNVEQGCDSKAIVMQPIQTVLPNKSGYHTPSPGRPSFSLGLTQFEKTPTPSPIQSIHPSLKKIKLGEIKEKQIRSWIVDSSLNKNQDLAKYEGRDYMVFQMKDFWSLKPHNWVNSCVIQWMCYSFNDIESSRFKRDFYCVSPGILVNAKRIAILDSLHSVPVHDERDKLDAYVGRLCEDMASIAIPSFVRSTYGPARSYAKVPIQPNNFDCGMCVIKLMERWTEDRELYEWDELISLLEKKGKPVRRNAPRNKKKDVSSPYTAPSTRSLIERAEGLPKGALRKGRKKLLT